MAAQPARSAAPASIVAAPRAKLPAMPQRATRRGASRVAAIMTSATVEKAALKAMRVAGRAREHARRVENTKKAPIAALNPSV